MEAAPIYKLEASVEELMEREGTPEQNLPSPEQIDIKQEFLDEMDTHLIEPESPPSKRSRVESSTSSERVATTAVNTHHFDFAERSIQSVIRKIDDTRDKEVEQANKELKNLGKILAETDQIKFTYQGEKMTIKLDHFNIDINWAKELTVKTFSLGNAGIEDVVANPRISKSSKNGLAKPLPLPPVIQKPVQISKVSPIGLSKAASVRLLPVATTSTLSNILPLPTLENNSDDIDLSQSPFSDKSENETEVESTKNINKTTSNVKLIDDATKQPIGSFPCGNCKVCKSLEINIVSSVSPLSQDLIDDGMRINYPLKQIVNCQSKGIYMYTCKVKNCPGRHICGTVSNMTHAVVGHKSTWDKKMKEKKFFESIRGKSEMEMLYYSHENGQNHRRSPLIRHYVACHPKEIKAKPTFEHAYSVTYLETVSEDSAGSWRNNLEQWNEKLKPELIPAAHIKRVAEIRKSMKEAPALR